MRVGVKRRVCEASTRECEIMQRKATSQSRAANALEKAHMQWIKERNQCAACGSSGVINHHCEGATFKVKVNFATVLIGHAFVIGLCQCCDNIITKGSRKAFRDAFGLQSGLWFKQYQDSPVRFPDEILEGIKNCGR